ncbi:MAG: DUF4366 domain-containing protein [Oscillospiraceae bacterium]|nr:DUF4366 domain-containing protein [Oscillospiraceae bacterium]
MKTRIYKQILAAVLIGGIFASFGARAFADEAPPEPPSFDDTLEGEAPHVPPPPPPPPQGDNSGMLTFPIPRGNATLIEEAFGVDTIRGLGRQFLTVQTRGGNTFYIIIETDMENGAQNVFFLNAVDDFDLFAFAEDFPSDFLEVVGAERRSNRDVYRDALGGHESNLPPQTPHGGNGGTQPPAQGSSDGGESGTTPATSNSSNRSSGMNNRLILLAVMGVGGAIFVVVIRKKKKAQGAVSADEGYEDDEG